MRSTVIFFTVLAYIFIVNSQSTEHFIEQQREEECRSEKIFVHPQMHRCLENSSEHKVYYNNLLQHMNTFQPSISLGNTEIEGKSEKHDLQHDVKENKRYYRTNEPEISSNYRMHRFKEMLKDHIKSEIGGCVCASNSSIELKEIGLIGGERGSVVRGRKGSVVAVRGCVVGMGKGNEAGAFDLCGSIGILKNITLNGWESWGKIYSGRLFGGRDEGEGSISVSESHFSSFCVSTAPFLSSPSIPIVSLSKLTFFNISTANDACSPSATTSTKASCIMSSCSFSSVCDTYDGGIVPSLNNPLASLSASNTSFVGCYRTRNVVCEGTSDVKLTPGRQNETDNGANSFTWCEWNGSKANGNKDDYADEASNGGAIRIYNLNSGELSVSHCSFNDCYAHYAGGGVHCHCINSVEIANNTFGSCTAQNRYGGGVFVYTISTCVRISGCEFQGCKANNAGGGLFLENFQVSGSGCIPAENGGGESACVFDCSFTSCSLSSSSGGGMYCLTVPVTFKMRSVQFISCSATANGGGFWINPNRENAPNDAFYCYFLFFHECKCSAVTPFGHDMMYFDYYSVYLSQNNPFKECYTTNADEKRMCYAYNYTGSNWSVQHTEKKDWLKRGILNRFVAVSGGGEEELCGLDESSACRTIGIAVEKSVIQMSLSVTLMEGKHVSETITIDIGEKKISVIGKRRETCSIGTGALSSTGALFSVSTGHLGLLHMKVDCNSNSSPSPSVVVVTGGNGSLSLEDVVITTSKTGEYVMSSSVFVVPLSQLLMVGVEIINMNVSKPLFSEPNLSPSSSSSLSSSALYLTAKTSGDSELANLSVMNVKLTEGDGVVVAKSVKEGETFVVRNVTIEECECKAGSGGGIKVELESSSSKLRVGSSSAPGSETTKFNRCKCSGYGGGVMLHLADDSCEFEITSVSFDGCAASLGGKNVFVEAEDLSAVINNTSIGFNPEIGINAADLNELCGRERNQTDVIVPLVVFLRTFSSPAYVSGREQGSEFRLCGYEDYPCKGIGNVGEIQFPSSERTIRLTNTFSFDEEVKLIGQPYEIDSSNKDVGIKIEATGTKMQEALVMNSVSSTLIGILFELGESIGERSSFVHSSGGTLRFADCGIKMGNGVNSANYEFVSASGGMLSISDFSMAHVKFGMKAFIVINGNGGASIGDSLLESVETTNMKGLIEYSSSSSSPLTIVNVTAQECVMGGKGLIWDDNGKKLGMRNCTIMKMSSLEGNGSVVSGEVGDGCAVEVNDVVIEGCGTLKGCGGGMSVILKGTGEMRLGKSGVVTSFEKCSAGGEGSVGGYGGGVLLRCEEGGRDFVMSGLTFGRGEGANTAAHGGNNVFVEGTNLYQLVNNVSFDFSFEIEGDDFNIEDLMGAEDGNELILIPVVVFFREKPSVGYVNGGNGGMDYHKCGYADFPCSTLTYAGTSVFDTSPATLKLVDGSSIFDEMTLNTQEMNIDGDIAKAKIGIVEGGENEFLIKSEQIISFSSLAFSISTFAESRKEYVFLCGASTLKFEGCSFGAESEEIGVGLICGKGGKVVLVKCEFGDFAMTKSGMVTFDGAGVGGLIDEVIVRNVTRENRGSGNGGVLNGRVGNGKCVDINKCVFEECRCNSVSAIGGGVVLIVGDGGNLLFDENKMNGCTVSERSGKGGGLHLTFETTNIEYSMKNDSFTNNVAEKGEDVYLVCGSPWTMLLQELWEGTATRVTAENKMWVLESSEPRKEDSLINYLFPRLGTDLFVSNSGNELSSCGAKENPCSSVDIGFDRLKDDIESIMLVSAASVSKPINRDGKGLTIKGNEETRELVVKEGGKFELTEGDGQTHLTLSLLQISLPCSSPASATDDESIVEVRIGQCFILDCLFTGGERNSNVNSNVNECGKWIVIGNGGAIRIERTEMNGMRFEGCGIAQLGGGNVIFENCSLNGIETSGGGVIVGNGGSEVTLRNMTALGCVVGAGSLITSNGGSSLRVDGGSRFENIETESVRGGCVKSEMKLNDLLEIGSSSILRCSANGNGGRGGGIYLDLSDDCVNNFALKTLTFEDNVAAEGRDLFISCKKLNETVMKERFGFEYENGEGEGEGEGQAVDMKGIDREHFAESVDLGLFLVEVKRIEVCVSREGYDTLGCGSDGYPCESMWSGISHIDRSETEGERKVKVRDEGTFEDIYSFTDALSIDGCVNEGDVIKHKTVYFEGTIKGNSAPSSSSVISSTVSLSLLSLKLKIPSQFEPNMNSLISSSGVLQLERCLFEIQSSMAIQYSLITTTTGSCTLKGCSLTGPSFVKSPLVMASSVLFENSSFSNIMNTGSGEGGVARVTLKNDEDLVIQSTNASSCSLSSRNGKGGFLYLDCHVCSNENPFIFDADVTFENNNAATGKNAFILGNDFNTSVTKDSFKFDYSSMANDGNLFVGNDNFHSNKDLFMFLVPYSSIEIFISSEGFDVARCGSEEEPCFTMWKGMENMKKEIEKKTIQIEGSTLIRDSFNVSNYQIKKGVKMGEENVKATLNFEKAVGSQLEYFMGNNIHLELSNIQLQLTSGFDNSAKTIFSNRDGELVITGCSFHSEAGVNNGFDCEFVDAIGGSVDVNDLLIESCNVGNSIFAIHDSGVYCQLKNIRVESLNESGGCILSIKESEPGLKINEVGEEINLNIDNSSFSGVKRSDNGASILESKSEKKIDLVVNSSNITEDKAETSEKGGALFFTLGASGSMKMIDSTISHCSCNNNTGRGGGVYLATKETGELNFTFMGMKFSANTARVGNDIFIECFNITSQINERQFQFDLRENHYSRINAIYGIDSCDHQTDTDLIGLITIHQSDTIIVCNVNGSNEKQCGTNTLPCDSIEHGLVHLTSDFMSLMFIVEESVIGREINLEEMSLSSKSREMCKVEVKSEIEKTKETLVTTTGTVSLLRMNFVFDSNFISSHESLISPEGGILEIMNCSFDSKQSAGEGSIELANIPFHIINTAEGELQVDGCTISNLILQKSSIYLSSPLPSVIDSLTICNSTIKTSLFDINECGQLNMEKFHSENITVEGNEESLISCLSMKKTIQLTNCTVGGVCSNKAKGKLMKMENCLDVKMDSCIFDGSSKERRGQNLNSNEEEEMCRWDGSLVDIVKSSVMMKDTTLSNSPEGGITMSGGNMKIEMGLFENNKPSIEGYPSARRNIICSDSGTLNVMSLKGGDGWERNTSLWILDDGCELEGITSERTSSFFIPVLEEVKNTTQPTGEMELIIHGKLLLPCNLSVKISMKDGDVELSHTNNIAEDGYISESEVHSVISSEVLEEMEKKTEVSVCIVFGKGKTSCSNGIVVINKSESQSKGDENENEGGDDINKGGSNNDWSLIVIVVLGVLLLIVLVGFSFIVVLLRKKLKEVEKKVEKERMENEEIMRKIERRRREGNGGIFEMNEMPSTLLEGMTSQIPLLIDNDEEDLLKPPSLNDGELNENDLPDLESSFPFSEDDSVSLVSQSCSLNVISAKKPFREKEKKNLKTLYSVIHSVEGDFTLGTRAMNVIDGKEVVLAVAELFEHLISVGDERIEMMGRQLCPYTIFVEEGNNEIFVLAEELEDEKQKEEMKRWSAPEVGNEDEEMEKTVVFSLGLILHEMTTGEVPLSECDAEEAQEMMRDGVRPLTEGIEGEDLVELMEKMWGDEPDGRPTLAEVKKSIKKMINEG
eukprot:MONOS_10961.1-p1 / transcript=MONOS_10961.1 / gene=MONOS_10961 / organism=Monocercomonoides_exilis_PA203 / gene_product=unspecified product / transcript_product=unspecified product / location=Mono_scaffold00522:11750-23009(-) / protein_length=3655 / sequence_SO=supercontig / SO=protein_coding / is_pseudo=false